MEKKELIEIINAVLDVREKDNFDPMGKLESDNLDKLAKALSTMQGEYESVLPNRVNPHFKSNYADLDAAIRSVRPLFKKYGFSFIQGIEFHRDKKRYLRTKLLHDSGQYISSFDIITQDRQGLQGYGTGLSYHKRYNACTLLGITISNDPDDNDAEVKKESNSESKQQKKDNNTNYKKDEQLLSNTEIEFINNKLSGHDTIKKEILNIVKKNTLEECPKKLFDTLVEFIDTKKETSSNNIF